MTWAHHSSRRLAKVIRSECPLGKSQLPYWRNRYRPSSATASTSRSAGISLKGILKLTGRGLGWVIWPRKLIESRMKGLPPVPDANWACTKPSLSQSICPIRLSYTKGRIVFSKSSRMRWPFPHARKASILGSVRCPARSCFLGSSVGCRVGVSLNTGFGSPKALYMPSGKSIRVVPSFPHNSMRAIWRVAWSG